MAWSDWKPFGNSQVIEIPVFSETTKTVELDIEPTHVVIYNTQREGVSVYPTIYTNGLVQTNNPSVCNITKVDGNKVTFSRASNNLSWSYILIAVAE